MFLPSEKIVVSIVLKSGCRIRFILHRLFFDALHLFDGKSLILAIEVVCMQDQIDESVNALHLIAEKSFFRQVSEKIFVRFYPSDFLRIKVYQNSGDCKFRQVLRSSKLKKFRNGGRLKCNKI